MNELFITNDFKNMIALKLFSNEVITVRFHQPATPDSINSDNSPGRTGYNADGSLRGTFGSATGLVNMNPDAWTIGDTAGEIINANDTNVGRLSSGRVTVSYYSLWRQDGTYLGYSKLIRDLRLPGGQSLRFARGLIKINISLI